MANPKAKTRPVENPYETFHAGDFEFRILKHYQGAEAEAKNPSARVLCATKSPYTGGHWEYGDAYLSDIRAAVESQGQRFSLE